MTNEGRNRVKLVQMLEQDRRGAGEKKVHSRGRKGKMRGQVGGQRILQGGSLSISRVSTGRDRVITENRDRDDPGKIIQQLNTKVGISGMETRRGGGSLVSFSYLIWATRGAMNLIWPFECGSRQSENRNGERPSQVRQNLHHHGRKVCKGQLGRHLIVDRKKKRGEKDLGRM